jgi:hypothetical protein
MDAELDDDGYEPDDEELERMRVQHAFVELVEAIAERRPVPAWVTTTLGESNGGIRIPAAVWRDVATALREAAQVTARMSDPEVVREVTSEVAAHRGWFCDPWEPDVGLVAAPPASPPTPRRRGRRPARRRVRARARSPGRPRRRPACRAGHPARRSREAIA